MSKHYKHTFFALTLMLAPISASIAWGSPAWRGTIHLPQADGSTVELYLHGDEFHNYLTTTDGYRVRRSAAGYYHYLDSGMHMTPLKVSDKESAEIRKFKKSFDPGKIAQVKTKSIARAKSKHFPSTGSPHTIVILAQFADESFRSSDPQTEFDELLNGENYDRDGATGSCRQFYRDNSMGAFSPTFDVYGPVTLSQGYRYYGENNQFTGQDLHAKDMVVEACKAIDEQIDFSEYDLDGDGVIDNVYVFYAGYGASDSGLEDRIWPHSYDYGLEENRVMLDGKRLGNYACSNEISYKTGKLTGIGTFVHEFGHCLGLPDMYNTVNQSASFSPGEWDYMDYGMYNNNSRTPPCATAYERHFLGWLEPQTLTQPDDLTLEHIASNKAYRIDTNMPDEYFLLENRQQQGWDAYIPGHGMLIWHIDYVKSIWDENRVNTNPSHQYVDILEADNIRSLESLSGDPFPGTSGKTAITDETQPNLCTWLGLGFGKTITSISESTDGLISFRYMGGRVLSGPPTEIKVTDITPTSCKASWAPVTDATHYIVSLRDMEAGVYVRDLSATECSCSFTDLNPSTKYQLTLRAADKYSVTYPSDPYDFETAPPTFDLIEPPAPSIVSISGSDATLRVEPVEGADSYLLSIYKKERGEAPVSETLDFSNGVELPAGWTSSSSSTISMRGYFGESAPALVLSSDEAYIQTPAYDSDVSALKFWLRGRSNVDGNSISVYGYNGRNWSTISTIEIPGDASTVTIDPDMLEGSRAIRIVYNKDVSAGNAVIDDVHVESGSELQRLYHPGYDQLAIEDAGEYIISALERGQIYYARCAAKQGDMTSRNSAETKFTVGLDAVETLTPGNATMQWRAEGNAILISGASPCQEIRLLDIAGRTIALTTATPEGKASAVCPRHGIYFLVSSGTTIKIII